MLHQWFRFSSRAFRFVSTSNLNMHISNRRTINHNFHNTELQCRLILIKKPCENRFQVDIMQKKWCDQQIYLWSCMATNINCNAELVIKREQVTTQSTSLSKNSINTKKDHSLWRLIINFKPMLQEHVMEPVILRQVMQT